MKVTLLGTGTSFPDPNRVQSGILIETDKAYSLFDIGSGVLHRLVQTQIDLNSIAGLFISHFHIDHCSDFVTLLQTLWLQGYDKHLQIFAPPPAKEWLRGIFEVGMPFYRDKVVIEPYILREHDSVQSGELSVSTCPTTHGTHDVRAFRIEHAGKSIAISSDTAPCRDIVELAKGVDVLVHECNWLDGSTPKGVHTSPSELTSIVEEINPKKVILTHMNPDVIRESEKVLSIVGRRTDAEIILGVDLMQFNL
ncbi:MAG: MBL fold metallo-hydrolase [Candidatus Thorarchaeota archaeon]|nr:MBL fold metallo-hydrolase [Candidatus Thorarchaeota archaeon]